MTDAKKEGVKQSSASKRPRNKRASKAKAADTGKRQVDEAEVLQPEEMKIYPKGYGQGKKGGRYGSYDHGTKAAYHSGRQEQPCLLAPKEGLLSGRFL